MGEREHGDKVDEAHGAADKNGQRGHLPTPATENDAGGPPKAPLGW